MSNLTSNTFTGLYGFVLCCDAEFLGQTPQDNIPTGGHKPCFLPVLCPATEGTAFLCAVALLPFSYC